MRTPNDLMTIVTEEGTLMSDERNKEGRIAKRKGNRPYLFWICKL
jgi:hypothetical protein